MRSPSQAASHYFEVHPDGRIEVGARLTVVEPQTAMQRHQGRAQPQPHLDHVEPRAVDCYVHYAATGWKRRSTFSSRWRTKSGARSGERNPCTITSRARFASRKKS